MFNLSWQVSLSWNVQRQFTYRYNLYLPWQQQWQQKKSQHDHTINGNWLYSFRVTVIFIRLLFQEREKSRGKEGWYGTTLCFVFTCFEMDCCHLIPIHTAHIKFYHFAAEKIFPIISNDAQEGKCLNRKSVVGFETGFNSIGWERKHFVAK